MRLTDATNSEFRSGIRCRSGMTLLEVLMVIAIVGALTPLLGQLFVSSARLTSHNGLALERLEDKAMLGRMFVDAVRDSAGVIAQAGEHVSGADKVVLRLGATEAGEHYCVIGTFTQPDQLARLDFIFQEGTYTATRFVQYAPKVRSVEMRYDAPVPAQARWVELRYSLRPEDGERDIVTPTQVIRVTPRTLLAEATR